MASAATWAESLFDELGRDFGTTIDVQSGLEGNETIVKQPTVSLQEGQVVTPIDSNGSPSG